MKETELISATKTVTMYLPLSGGETTFIQKLLYRNYRNITFAIYSTDGDASAAVTLKDGFNLDARPKEILRSWCDIIEANVVNEAEVFLKKEFPKIMVKVRKAI
jgi:hypothetical protein